MINAILKYSIVVFAILMLSACISGTTRVSALEYREVINKERGLRVEEKYGPVTLAARYRPIEELIVEGLHDRNLDDSLYHSLYNKHKDLQYFTFTVSSDETKEILSHNNMEEDSYFQMLDYLSNGIQNDFYLVENGDTLPCLLCHYERNYGLTSLNRISLAFQNKHKTNMKYTGDKILAYEDKLFDIGLVHFKIREESLNNLPILSYEK